MDEYNVETLVNRAKRANPEHYDFVDFLLQQEIPFQVERNCVAVQVSRKLVTDRITGVEYFKTRVRRYTF